MSSISCYDVSGLIYDVVDILMADVIYQKLIHDVSSLIYDVVSWQMTNVFDFL